jgi:hypothetical protein
MEQKAKTGKSGFTVHLFAVNLLEKLVERFKGLLTEKILDFCIKWLLVIGHVGIIVSAGLGFFFSLIYAIKENSFNGFLMGIVWVLLLFVVQYTAHKFSTAGEDLIKNNPSQLASKTFLDCFGFLVLIGGVVVFIMALVGLIKGMPFSMFLEGLALFVFMEFVALIAFNPKTITVKVVKSNSAGQEALGIITFFVKTIMKLVPILFGALIVVGTVMLFVQGIKLFGASAGFVWIVIQRGVARQILFAAMIPFLSYITFVLAYLNIDLIRAILSIPENK